MRKVIYCLATFALVIFSQVFLIAQSSEANNIDLQLHLADSLRRKSQNETSSAHLDRIKNLQNVMSHAQHAKFFKLSGINAEARGEYVLALEAYNSSKKELEKDTSLKSQVNLINLFTLRGGTYFQQGEYETAKEIFLKGITEADLLPEKEKATALRYLYNNLAGTYDQLGQYDNSVNTSFKVLKILETQQKEESIGGGVAHNNLGISYRRLGRNKLANEHYSRAAEIFSKTLGENSRYTLGALGNAAIAINEYGDIEKAIPIHTRLLELKTRDKANTYASLGWVYKRIGEYDKSVEAYEQAITDLRSSKDSVKVDMELRFLRNLAIVETRQQAFEKARQHIDEAFEIYSTSQNINTQDLVMLLGVDASYHEAVNDFDRHFNAIKKANDISIKDTENHLKLILKLRPRYIKALIDRNEHDLAGSVIDSTYSMIETHKGSIPYSSLMLVEANLDGLKARMACAKNTAQQALSDKLDEKLMNHVTKLIAATASAPGKKNQRYSCSTCFNIGDLLESLVNLHLKVASSDSKEKDFHIQKALTYLDIKQSYLTNIWKNEHFAGLSKEQKEHAKEIRQRIAAYELFIFENDANTPAAQRQNALYLDSILVLRPQLEKYIGQVGSPPIDFENTFKYRKLPENQGFLALHQEGDILHVIFADNNGIQHHSTPGATKLKAQFIAYTNYCQSDNTGFIESKEILNTSADVYAALLGWIPGKTLAEATRIGVIESSLTQGLPFAALLTEPVPKGAHGFREVQFAVNRHAFSYHQSPSSFFEAQQKSHYSSKIKLTALAPSQLASSSIASTTEQGASNFGLGHAAQEVKIISEKFKGTILSGNQADISGLKNAFLNSNVIHVASHAASNYDDGEFSYIVVTDTAQMSGERLYARTLSELELPADLIVLGACESGFGKFRRGEGTVSLANVFLNVGTQSVLHTSWRVEDKRSKEVLLGFYDELKENLPLDQALVGSQRSYLESAAGQYLHPFYWAPFAMSGNLTPIESNWTPFAYYGLPILALILLFFFWKRR